MNKSKILFYIALIITKNNYSMKKNAENDIITTKSIAGTITCGEWSWLGKRLCYCSIISPKTKKEHAAFLDQTTNKPIISILPSTNYETHLEDSLLQALEEYKRKSDQKIR